TNSGVVTGGASNVIVFDIDTGKGLPDAERECVARKILAQLLSTPIRAALQRALIRVRLPGSIALLLRADRPMTKYKVAGEHGGVELLAEGQFLVIHGDHKDEADIGPGRSWSWMHERAPWNTPVNQLPIVNADAAIAALDAVRAAGVLGP